MLLIICFFFSFFLCHRFNIFVFSLSSPFYPLPSLSLPLYSLSSTLYLFSSAVLFFINYEISYTIDIIPIHEVGKVYSTGTAGRVAAYLNSLTPIINFLILLRFTRYKTTTTQRWRYISTLCSFSALYSRVFSSPLAAFSLLSNISSLSFSLSLSLTLTFVLSLLYSLSLSLSFSRARSPALVLLFYISVSLVFSTE